MKIEYTEEWFHINKDSIKEWFDPETFDWKYGYLLAVHCHNEFKIWFDPTKYNWTASSRRIIATYCIRYIDIWFDSSRFSKSYDEYLIRSIK